MNNAKQPPLPKTANMPPPRPETGPEAFAPRGHNTFLTQAMHEDVGRVMQNIIDLQTEVAQLRKKNQEWERRALLAEGKVEQLKQEMTDLKDDFAKDLATAKDHHVEELAGVQKQLDYYKNRDAVVQTKLHIGAQHFLDCIQAVEKERKDLEQTVMVGMEAEISKMLADAKPEGPSGS
jgi:chromosome segregation ATPase